MRLAYTLFVPSCGYSRYIAIMQTTNGFLTETEVAQLLGCSAATMRLHRATGRGPSFYKVGKRVLYRGTDLETYLASRRVDRPKAPTTHGRKEASVAG